MIDIFTVVMPHALMAIAVWRLLGRDDLDNDPFLPSFKALMGRRKGGPAAPQGEDRPGA